MKQKNPELRRAFKLLLPGDGQLLMFLGGRRLDLHRQTRQLEILRRHARSRPCGNGLRPGHRQKIIAYEPEFAKKSALGFIANIESMNKWAAKPLSISATCHVDGSLYVRLSGAAAAVTASQKRLGGDIVEDGAAFWKSIREQTHPLFRGAPALWRFSIKPTAAPLSLGTQLIEWSGGLRWIAADLDPSKAFDLAHKAGGHATLFRGGNKRHGIQQFSSGLVAVHKKLKRAFDPHGILGPGRIHADF